MKALVAKQVANAIANLCISAPLFTSRSKLFPTLRWRLFRRNPVQESASYGPEMPMGSGREAVPPEMFAKPLAMH